MNSNGTRALLAGVGIALALGVGTAAVIAAEGNTEDRPIPVEPDGGIGDTPGEEFQSSSPAPTHTAITDLGFRPPADSSTR